MLFQWMDPQGQSDLGKSSHALMHMENVYIVFTYLALPKQYDETEAAR